MSTESLGEPENGIAELLRQTEKSATPVTVGTPGEAPPPVVPGPDFNPLVYWLQPRGKPGVCGHASHGAAGNLIKRSTGKCKRCEDAKAVKNPAACGGAFRAGGHYADITRFASTCP